MWVFYNFEPNHFSPVHSNGVINYAIALHLFRTVMRDRLKNFSRYNNSEWHFVFVIMISESSVPDGDTKSPSAPNSPIATNYSPKRPISLTRYTHITPDLYSPTGSSISGTAESGTVSSSFDSLDANTKDTSLSLLCSGLLRLLTGALIVLPDANLKKVISIVLKPETLIVLAHHESAEIRTNVVKVCTEQMLIFL